MTSLQIPSALRALSFLLLPVMAAGSFVGCGGDAAPLFMEIGWRARRPNLLSATDHTIVGLDGAMGRDLSCSVGDSNGSKTLAMDAEDMPGYAVTLRGVLFDPAGGPAQGASCLVEVAENNTVYRGKCGSAEPNASQPCRLSDLIVSQGEAEGPTVFGSLRCVGLPARTDRTLTINLTGPGDGPEAEASSIGFRLVNCNGLAQD